MRGSVPVSYGAAACPHVRGPCTRDGPQRTHATVRGGGYMAGLGYTAGYVDSETREGTSSSLRAANGRCVPARLPLLRSAGVEDDPHRIWRFVRKPDEHLLRTLHHLPHLVLLQVVVHLPQPRAVLASWPTVFDTKGQVENADRLKEPRGILWGQDVSRRWNRLPTQGRS